jgi:hypothetical protein
VVCADAGAGNAWICIRSIRNTSAPVIQRRMAVESRYANGILEWLDVFIELVLGATPYHAERP